MSDNKHGSSDSTAKCPKARSDDDKKLDRDLVVRLVRDRLSVHLVGQYQYHVSVCDEARGDQLYSNNASSPQSAAKLPASAARLSYTGLAHAASLCISVMPLPIAVLAPRCDRSSYLERFIAVGCPVDKVFP